MTDLRQLLLGLLLGLAAGVASSPLVRLALMEGPDEAARIEYVRVARDCLSREHNHLKNTGLAWTCQTRAACNRLSGEHCR